MNQENLEFWNYWIEPYYMFLFNTRWCLQSDPLSIPHFVKLVQPVLPKVSDRIIEKLLIENIGGWRSRVVGCWFAGIKRREPYIDEISKSLGYNFSQMSTCFALVRFNNQQSIACLSQYIEQLIACERNLADEHWNNIHWGWAIQALTYLNREQEDYFYIKYHLAKSKLKNNDLNIICLKEEHLVFKRMEKFCELYFVF